MVAGVTFEVHLSLPTFMAVRKVFDKKERKININSIHNLDHEIIIFVFCRFEEYARREIKQTTPWEIIKRFFLAFKTDEKLESGNLNISTKQLLSRQCNV